MRTLINTLLVVGMSVFVPGLACATPTGGTVVGGAASISQSGNTTTINQTSQNAIINWQSFNTNPSEVAQFIQPNSSAAALNRITNGLPTTFQGQLLANGRVFIVNPNGILFTGTSSINVGSLFATTADIQNSDFMNGNYHFQQAPNNFSSVINNGSITANGDASIGGQGLVALVAPGVQNNGVITANMGKVVLASGTSYTVDFYGDQLINFDVGSNVSQKPHDTNGNTLNELVSNNGEIYANGGKVILTARAASNVVDNVISMGGYIEAKSAAVGSNGVIILGGSNGAVKVSGKINVSGKHLARKGGTVKVLGQYVQLTDNASIDASGDIGGGTILIGGNAAGLGPEPNSLATYIGPQVTLDASATDNGNGGNIVTWGTNVDQIYGTLLARGGPNGGNGGFIETSGHWVDTYGIQINASAPLGAAGTWLLDPLNLVVTAPDNNLNITGGNPTTIKPGTAGTGTVDPTTITNLLSLGTSVILTTSGTIGGSFGDITVSSAINAGSADPSASLTLDAVGSIIVNASINLAGSLILHSTNNISISAPITTSNLSGINTVTSGSITMTADLGNIIVNSNVTTGNANSSSGDATTGSINLSAHGSGGLPNAIFINSPLTTGTATGTTISTSGNISVTNFRAGIFASGNPALVIGDTTSGTGTAGSISLSSTNGNIDNGAGGAIQIQQGLFSGGGNEGTLTVNTIGSGNAFIDTTGNSNTDTILQTSNIAGDFQLTSAGPNSARIIQLGGSLTVGGTTTITANGGENITLTNPNNSFTGAVSLTNTNNANTSISATGSAANNSLIFGTTSVGSGNFNIVFQGNGSSNPTITQTGSITTAGPTSITLNSSGVDISLANATNFFNGGLPVNNSAGNIHNFGLNDATTNAGSTFTSNYFSDMSNLVDLTLNFGNGDLNLPAILAHGNATLISPAGMHQTAPIVVNGNTSLTTNGSPSSIDFQTNGTNNAFTGPISLTGGNIYIVNSVPTILDTSTTDILSIFSGGSITQVGTITTHGLFTIQPNVASSDILLANFPNDFQANLAIVNPGNIRDFKIRNVDAGGGIQIPGLTGMNNLRDLTLIFDNAPGTGTFTIQDLSFAALSLRDVDLEFGAAGLVLNNITNTPQAGNLIAHANGSITQAPQSFEALHIGGTSDFAAAANPITLTNTHNTFTGAVTFFNSGTNDVSVFDSIALLLGASSIGQNFFATAGGSISQAPASTLSVGGNTTLGVSAGGSDILLGNTGNDFAGTISFSNTFPADLANIRDINIDNSNASATVPDFTGLTNLRNLTLTFENNSMTFGSSITLNNGGSFNLFDTSNTANKDIDFGTGLSFIAGDNTVTGTNQTVIGGSVNASSTNGNILGSSTLQSGAATLTDNVGATGGTDTVTSGSISLAAPSGTVSASLGLSFGNATLNDQGNSTNNVTSGGYSLSQSPSIVLSPITTGSATFAGTNITATSVNTITSGNLSFTSTTGNITGTTLQTGNVLISGTLPVDTTTQLNSGSVTLNAGGSTGGVGIGLSGSPAIITGNATNSTGTPTGVTANGGNLTLISAGEIDNGTIGNALSIQLGSATGAATTNSGTLSITTTTANGNALINATTPVNLGTSSISQFLNLVAAGNISQSGTLTISGGNTLTSSFNAGANTITLNDATNNISTNVSLTTTGVSNDATIFNSVPLSFDTSSVTGNLIADTSAGNAAITQLLTGTGLAITGTSTFNAGAATITLNNTNNTLTGAVSFNNAGANDISVVNNTNLIFGNSTIGNNLTATANGTITQVAPLTIPGTSSFTANGGNDITLNDPNNDFTGAVSFTDSGSANTSVTDTNSLILGTLNLGSGALNIAFGANTTNPSLSQTGVLTVPGTTNITVNGAAGGSDVLLGSFANVFSSLPIINSAANVRDFALRDTTAGSGTTFSANYFSNMTGLRNLTLFFDNGALTLPDATLTAGGNLIATTSAGAISQNVGTTLIVPGTSTFTATGAHAITVANTNNQFTGDFIFTNGAAPVSVLDSIALSFGTSSTAGNLIATGAGISESGTLSVSGTSNFTATGNNAISLTNANSLGGAVLFNNGNANVDITNATNLIFGPTTSTTGGNLTADATGSITQTGALSVAGTSSFSSGANPITLNNASNSFTDAVSFSNSGSNDVSVVDGIALLLGTSTIGQNFSATAGGTGIAQSGGTTLTIGNTGTTTLGVSALNGDIILGNTGNNLGTSVIFTNGIPVDIRDINLDNNNTAAAVPSFTGLTNLRNLTLTFENNSMIFGSSITLNHGGSFNLFDTSNTANKDIDFGSGLSFIAGINTVTGTSQTVTGGNVNATSNNGSILGSSTLQSGAATLNDTVGATGGTDTVTSGSIALSAPSGTVSNTLALSFGNATLNGTGNSTNNVTSGGYSLSQSSSIALPSITTGTATFAGTNITANSINTITSGDISFISTNGNITGSSLQTGNVSLSGTLPSNTTTQLIAGNITLNAGGAAGGVGIGLTGSPALVTGNATNSTGTSTGVTTSGGNISLTATATSGEIDNGTLGSPLVLQLGNNGTLAISQNATSNGNAFINALSPVVFTNSNVSNNLALTAAGAISQINPMTVGGTSSFTSGANPITLTNTGNNFTGDVSFFNSGNNNVSVNTNDNINLGASTIGGTFTASIPNSIVIDNNISLAAGSGLLLLQADTNGTHVGSITNPSNSTLTIGSGGIALTAGSGIGTLANPILTSSAATTNLAAQNFAGSIFINNIGGALNITTVNGVVGISTIDSSDITINQTGNLNILSPVSTGNAFGVVNDNTSGSIFLNTLTSGNISIGAAVTTGSATTVGTGTNDTATSGSIAINAAGSVSGTGALSTGDASLASGTAGGTDSITSGSISLVANSGGIGLSANPALTIGNATNNVGSPSGVTATAGNIALSAAGEINNGTAATPIKLQFATPSGAAANLFGTLALITTGASGNAYIDTTAATTPIQLAASNISQLLNLTTAGDITQTGSLTILGGNTKTSSFNAGAYAITLTNASNDITSNVSLNNSGANNASIFDLVALTFDNSSIGGTLTATTSNNAIAQKAGSTLTVNGVGTSTFNSGAAPITLANTGNTFTGPLALTTTGANDANILNSIALSFDNSSIGGNLTATAGGNIAQVLASTLSVGGNTILGSSVAASDILLGNTGNNFAGTISFSSTAPAVLANIRDVNLDNANSGALVPSFTGLTNLRNLTLNFENAGINFNAPITLHVNGANTGNLSATANGAITQSGILTVPGTSSFISGANPITLNSANSFTGAVTFTNSGANDVSVVDSIALLLGTSTIGQNFSATAGGTGISQSGGTTLTIG
ncbi:MAG: hypothetical protein JSS53_10400, partial [Proteobacteria bacterium]|nr:hypothetical protein [Pseudomonadota bacterium]